MEEETITKKFKLKKKYKVLILIVVFLLFVVGWSRYISTRGFVVHEHRVTKSNLPTSFHGLKILHFSDLHYGRTIHDKEFEKIVNKINLIKPDIVFFTGDLIDKDIMLTEEIKNNVTTHLRNIEALYGKYAVSEIGRAHV